MDFKLFIQKNELFRFCPGCKKNGTLVRVKSKITLINYILGVLSYKEFHCKECKWNGYQFIYKITKNYIRILFNYFYLFIILFIGMIIFSYLLKRFIR